MVPSLDPTDHALDALGELIRSERAALAALARAEGVSAEDAVDCVQEGICTLVGFVRRGELPADRGAWGGVLATMVRNAARNRRRRHFRSRPHDELDAHALPAHEAPATDEVLMRVEDCRRLRACVAELCGVQRAVVTLRVLDERPGEDVARALGITPAYVAVLLHRAKTALRACMIGHGSSGRSGAYDECP